MAIENIQNNGPSLPAQDKIAKRKKEPIDLPLTMKPTILNMLARWGQTEAVYNRIADTMLEEFNIVADPKEIARLGDSNRNKVVAIRKEQREGIALQSEKLLNKTTIMLEREIDRASRDMEKRDALDAAFDAGAIDSSEHRKAMKNLRILTISDIVKLANHLTPKQAPQPLAPPQLLPQLPDGNSPQESALSKELAAAVEKGDAVEIQRIMWSKKTSAQSTFSTDPIADSENSQGPTS